jgi:hypothetical protein
MCSGNAAKNKELGGIGCASPRESNSQSSSPFFSGLPQIGFVSSLDVLPAGPRRSRHSFGILSPFGFVSSPISSTRPIAPSVYDE